MRMRLLEEWNDFASKVLPPDCSTVQRIEMRRAFYAGAAGIFDKLMKSLGPDTGEPSAEDIQVMVDFHNELNLYAEDLEAGRA